MTRASNSDFAISYMALRSQARQHGLDVRDENMTAFLEHVAEVLAQSHTHERDAMKYLHLYDHKPEVTHE